MNVRTERQTDRQTDQPHKLHVYVGLAQSLTLLIFQWWNIYRDNYRIVIK